MANEMVKDFATFWAGCPDAACMLDARGNILTANPAFEALIGAKVGLPFAQHANEECRAQLNDIVSKIIEGESGRRISAIINNGAENPTVVTWQLWRTGSAEAPVIAVATRTNEDHPVGTHGEEILRAHQIIDTSPTFIVAITGAGATSFMNSTMLKALGYTREEVVGKNYLEMFVPARERPALIEVFQSLSTLNESTLSENCIVARDGREIRVEWHGRPVFDKEGRLQFFYGMGIDVTEQRRTQNDLHRSQQRLALHFQQSPLGMIEWDREFRVSDWNPAAERIFGYSREEALGRYGQDLVVPEAVRPYVADVWQQLLDSRGAVNAHNENITKDGRSIVCEWSNTTLVDANGDVVGVASLVNDVTDRKKAEEDLRDRERAQAATIAQLSVPIIDIWEGILALPIVGTIDESRAVRMTEALLEAIVRNATRFAILDLTGATAVDATIANHLGDMIRATRLVGSECLVSGLGPEIARKLVEFDIGLSVRTFGSLRAALRHASRNARNEKPGPF